jgi:hypothetical protein
MATGTERRGGLNRCTNFFRTPPRNRPFINRTFFVQARPRTREELK